MKRIDYRDAIYHRGKKRRLVTDVARAPAVRLPETQLKEDPVGNPASNYHRVAQFADHTHSIGPGAGIGRPRHLRTASGSCAIHHRNVWKGLQLGVKAPDVALNARHYFS